MLRYAPIADGMKVSIKGDVTIYRAAELWQALLEALAELHGGQLVLDLSEVTEMDASGLQILMAAGKYCHQRGAGMTLASRSQAVAMVLDLARIHTLFDQPPATAGECH